MLALDVAGKVRLRLSPAAGAFHPGDVSVSGSRVFASDSQSGLIFEILANGTEMSAVNTMGDGKSGQGTALAPDRKHLLAADYSRGVGWIDLSTSRTTVLPRQDGKPLRGIDGLARCGTVYYGIYNGTTPGTLVAIRPGTKSLSFDQPLGDVTLPDPTQVAFDGRRLLIVADSGWANIDKAGFTRTQGASVVAIPLRRNCEVR